MIQPVSNSGASAQADARIVASPTAIAGPTAFCSFVGYLVGERVGAPVAGTLLGVGVGLTASSCTLAAITYADSVNHSR